MLDNTDWDNIILQNDVNKAAEQWCDHFLAIMEECIPHRYLQKRCNLPWLIKNIMKLIRKHNALFKRAKRTKDHSDFAMYKSFRNRIVKSLRNGKFQYFNSLTNADHKSFWKCVKTLNKNRETIPTLQ